ncbi:MAG: alcohol dehydrogenase, partial [Betaproteobacteria bacterium]|nr:alcohol dehydrogenase [Betaproteobacteria bacterium]
MKAAVAVSPGETQVMDLEPYPLAADSGLLRVAVTGVCGSDWGYYQNLPKARGPL